MAIIPDNKDWTWVLEQRCPECGFVSVELPRDQIAPMIRANAQEWIDILADDPVQLRRRARDDRWSRLEYACHVRDVFRIVDERLNLMLTSDDPTYQNWDQDRTAVEDHYGDQDPRAPWAPSCPRPQAYSQATSTELKGRLGNDGEPGATAPNSRSRPSASTRSTTSCIISTTSPVIRQRPTPERLTTSTRPAAKGEIQTRRPNPGSAALSNRGRTEARSRAFAQESVTPSTGRSADPGGEFSALDGTKRPSARV